MNSSLQILESQDWYDKTHAEKIKARYPNVSSVHIEIERCLLNTDVKKEDLSPEDPVHLSINCLNPDCTKKFILTNILEESLRTGKHVTRRIPCSGQESSKPGAYRCSCTLTCTITPILK